MPLKLWRRRVAERAVVPARAAPYRNLLAVVGVGRSPDQTTASTGEAFSTMFRDQSEHEALAGPSVGAELAAFIGFVTAIFGGYDLAPCRRRVPSPNRAVRSTSSTRPTCSSSVRVLADSPPLSRRRGPACEVALVERFGCFGGNITAVGVEGFAWYRHEQTVEAGGIGWEFEERAKAMGAAVPESQSLSYELDSEGFKLVADRLVEEAGIHPMLHRQFVAPLMDGDTIIGVVTESKAGREAILARRVVDATGDADVGDPGGRSGAQDAASRR